MTNISKISLLFVLFILLLTFCGCAPMVVVQQPTPPRFPYITEVPFSEPAFADTKFTAKDGKKSKIEDNVVVDVDSILNEYKDKAFSIKITGPNGKPLVYSLFPMVVILKITNNTDHIVTLERTIVRLEDENQKEYPMVSTAGENKQYLIDKITKATEDYKKDFKNYNESKYKELLFSDAYKKRYDDFVNTIKEAKAKGANISTPELRAEQKQLTEWGVNNLIKKSSPEGVFEENSHDLFNSVLPYIQNANYLRDEAIKVINAYTPTNLKGIITSGVYQPINILPGRTEKVIVPFAKRSDDEKIRTVRIGVYDLPTQVNQAGIPTKRANFNFEMVAVD